MLEGPQSADLTAQGSLRSSIIEHLSLASATAAKQPSVDTLTTGP